MSIGFGTALGVAATDRIDAGLNTHSTQRTWAFRVTRNGAGGGSFGRFLSKGATNAALSENFAWNSTFSLIAFTRARATTSGTWTIPGTEGVNTPYNIVFAYNSANASNTPVVWVNGSLVTPTLRTTTPTGAAITDTANYFIGNTQPGDRVWDGTVAEVAIWNESISPDLAIAISKGFAPLIWRPNLVYYNPLIRTPQDLIGGRSQVVTGTAVRPHPRIICR